MAAVLNPMAGGGHPDQDGGAIGDAVTVRIPLTFRKRGGRKVVMAPDGTVAAASLPPRVDTTLVKALARAFRWRKLLETGVYATVQDIATAEKINPSYVSRVLRLTLLAPNIVEAILEGRQATDITLAGLMKGVPVMWNDQVPSS